MAARRFSASRWWTRPRLPKPRLSSCHNNCKSMSKRAPGLPMVLFLAPGEGAAGQGTGHGRRVAARGTQGSTAAVSLAAAFVASPELAPAAPPIRAGSVRPIMARSSTGAIFFDQFDAQLGRLGRFDLSGGVEAQHAEQVGAGDLPAFARQQLGQLAAGQLCLGANDLQLRHKIFGPDFARVCAEQQLAAPRGDSTTPAFRRGPAAR